MCVQVTDIIPDSIPAESPSCVPSAGVLCWISGLDGSSQHDWNRQFVRAGASHTETFDIKIQKS